MDLDSFSRSAFVRGLAAVIALCTSVVGAHATPISISSIADLQDIQSNLSGDYVLTGNLDASATASWNSGAGFLPIGDNSTPFTGMLEGNGYTISNLTINSPVQRVGLFGDIGASGLIENLTLSNANVRGGNNAYVGILAGENTGTIISTNATGSVVTGNTLPTITSYNATPDTVAHAVAGGLVGVNLGAIQSSSAGTSVSGGDGSFTSVGGLIGENDYGTIRGSHATGTVLVGSQFVSAGGLVGSSLGGTISQSYATGAATGGSISFVGGLVGETTTGNLITQSYAAGSVTVGPPAGTFSEGGGLVGFMAGGTLSDSYATGSVTSNSAAVVGGAVGGNYYGNITQSYSTGLVTTPLGTYRGGYMGINGTSTGTVSAAYFDTDTSGLTQGVGQDSGTASVQGLTTAQLTSGTLPTGFDSGVWTVTAGTFPALGWQQSAVPAPVIVLDTSIPPVHTSIAIPIEALPSPENLLQNIAPFVDQYSAELPSDSASYLMSATSEVDNLGLKADAGIAAVGLQATADILGLANPSKDALYLTTVGLSGISAAVGLGFNIPSAITTPLDGLQGAAALSLIGSDAALAAAGCGDVVSCIPSVISFALSDLVVPAIIQFTKNDPPDLNYQTIFVLPATIPSPTFFTSDASLNSVATSTLSGLEAAAAYLFAANTSLNRYSSALAAGDTASALMQLEAFVHYIDLYHAAMLDASAELDILINLPELQIATPVDVSAFLEFQQDVEANGLTSVQIEGLQQFGLSDTQIAAFVNALDTYEPPFSSAAYESELGSLNDSVALAAGTPIATSAPESNTFTILFPPIFALISLRRRYRPHLFGPGWG